MARSPRRFLGGLSIVALLAAMVSAPTLAATPAAAAPAIVAGAIGEGASDVNAFFTGSIKGIVHGAVLGDGSVRVRTMVRGGDTGASYRVVGSSTPCAQAVADKLVLLPATRIMGRLVSRTVAAGALPDRSGVLVSIRIVRSTGGQVACAEALSYEPVPVTTGATPALELKDIVISSFMSPERPRGLLFTADPDGTSPQLRWSFTGLSGVPSYRIVGSTAPCGSAATPANQAFRSALQTKPYGFTEVTGLDIQVESFRIVAKGGKQLACTGRGRHVTPLF